MKILKLGKTYKVSDTQGLNLYTMEGIALGEYQGRPVILLKNDDKFCLGRPYIDFARKGLNDHLVVRIEARYPWCDSLEELISAYTITEKPRFWGGFAP